MKKKTSNKTEKKEVSFRKMTFKEKIAYFVDFQRRTRDYPEGCFDIERDKIKKTFLEDCQQTCEFISTADTDELECFVWVMEDFMKKYPKSNALKLCVERKAQVGDFYTLDWDFMIECIKKYNPEYLQDN